MKHTTLQEDIKETLVPLIDEESDKLLNLVIYTDGGCANTGDKLGGWGVHGYYFNDKETKSNSGCKKGVPCIDGYVTGSAKNKTKANVLAYFDYFGSVQEVPTTNNLAEMMAFLKALDIIKAYPVKHVQIFIDSDYVRRGLLEWLPNWKDRDWISTSGKPVANKDVWIEIEKRYNEVLESLGNDNLQLIRIDGHSGDIGNDKADELATAGAWGQRSNADIPGYHFTIKEVNDYWTSPGLNKMFTESRLFFDEASTELEGNWYYQGHLPYTGSETDKEKNLGKRVTDLTLSVLFLNEPEVVIDRLQNYVVKDRNYHGIFKARLDLINKDENYKHLLEHGDGRYLIYDDNANLIQSPTKAALVNGINTARLAYRIFIEFDLIRSVLQSTYSNTNTYGIKTLDITDYMYLKVKKSKKSEKLITKVNPDLGDSIAIGHSEVGDIPSQVTLTLGIDCPSKVSLGRLKDLSPKVQLLFYPQSKNKYSYYVAIETSQGIGIWCAPYSNTVLLPDTEDKP